LILLNHR